MKNIPQVVYGARHENREDSEPMTFCESALDLVENIRYNLSAAENKPIEVAVYEFKGMATVTFNVEVKEAAKAEVHVAAI